MYALAHWRPGPARKLGQKESVRVGNPDRVMLDYPDWQACRRELRVIPLSLEQAPPAEFPAPLAHAQQTLALGSRTVREMANQVQTCLTLGYLPLSLEACRSFDRIQHVEGCPHDRRDR